MYMIIPKRTYFFEQFDCCHVVFGFSHVVNYINITILIDIICNLNTSLPFLCSIMFNYNSNTNHEECHKGIVVMQEIVSVDTVSKAHCTCK